MFVKKDVSEVLAKLECVRDEMRALAMALDYDSAEILSRLDGQLYSIQKELYRSETYLVIRDNDDDTTSVKYFSDGDYNMFREAARVYCFSDCDDTFSIDKIVFEGRECYYVGWQQGMLFQFRYEDTEEVAFENYYPQWEH